MRVVDFDCEVFVVDYDIAVVFLCECCDRVLVVIVLVDLGCLFVGHVCEVNEAIEVVVACYDAFVFDLCDFGACNFVMIDYVYLIVFG